MHASKDSMWWRIWKLLQIFSGTKQGLSKNKILQIQRRCTVGTKVMTLFYCKITSATFKDCVYLLLQLDQVVRVQRTLVFGTSNALGYCGQCGEKSVVRYVLPWVELTRDCGFPLIAGISFRKKIVSWEYKPRACVLSLATKFPKHRVRGTGT